MNPNITPMAKLPINSFIVNLFIFLFKSIVKVIKDISYISVIQKIFLL